MAILVSNAVDSSDEICEGGCDSWIEHWLNNTNNDGDNIQCSVVGCNETEDLVGGHVYREDEDGDDCYIIPLCRGHNHFEQEYLKVRDETEFIDEFELLYCTDNLDDEDDEE